MSFSVSAGVPALTVFVQGLLSFFSPCVLPLVPLYVGYFAGGAKKVEEDGTISYPRAKIIVNTLFFVIGVSMTFFLLGLGFTALGEFFSAKRLLFARASGIIMIAFGLYQFGFFGKSAALQKEHRLPLRLEKWSMGPLPAFILGFAFSFAWTPCVGPALGSVLLMAGSAGSSAQGFMLIGVYTLGFVLPFVAVGLFTGAVLDFFKKHGNAVRYTVKAGAALMIIMGIMTFTGFMNGVTGYLSGGAESSVAVTDTAQVSPSAQVSADVTEQPGNSGKNASEEKLTPAPDFTLTDQNGVSHTLSEYKGKTVFINFWATWCPPCRGEMPDIQKLYEKYGENSGDLIVIGIAGPGMGSEGSVSDVSSFLKENGYSFPVLMDESGEVFSSYGISSFPTTFMIDKDGNVFGYASGAMTADIMESVVQQTMTGLRAGS